MVHTDKIHIMEVQVRNYQQELRAKDVELFDLKGKICAGNSSEVMIQSQVKEISFSFLFFYYSMEKSRWIFFTLIT